MTIPPPHPPPAPRRVMRLQLGVLLRRHREAGGATPKDVMAALDWYPSKLSKLENGGVTVSAAELDRLLELYGVAGEDADKARELGRQARRRGIPQPAREYARTYLELEQAADAVRCYSDERVPGMLQSHEYARALMATSPSNFTAEQLDTYSSERVHRLAYFAGRDGGSLWVVLGEAALHRPVGGRKAHREQLIHLRQAAGFPRLTLQILPFASGEHPAIGVEFAIVEVAEPPLAFVYSDRLTDGTYLDGSTHLDRYRVAFTKLQVAAADERESIRLLEARIRDLG